MPNSIVTDLKTLASKTAADNGFDIVGLGLTPKKTSISIQIEICRHGGGDVTLDDCALLTNPLSDAFEHSQLLDKPYVLEVSSPGIGDLLKNDRDFQTFQGFPVEVKHQDEKHAEKNQSGLLHEKTEDYLVINKKGRLVRLPLKGVKQVRLTSPKE